MGIVVIVGFSGGYASIDTAGGHFNIQANFYASDGVNASNDLNSGVNCMPPLNANKRVINDTIIDTVTAAVESAMGGTVDKIFFQPFDRG